MKKITLGLTIFALIVITSQASAQTEITKEIRKEVTIEDKNGVKTLSIETTENGRSTSEIYTGAEADKKIAELEKQQSGTTKTMVIDDNGEQQLKIEKKIVIKEELEIED